VSRELSAGGVLVKRGEGGWDAAVIQPRGKPKVRALPKGHIDPGEQPEATALREVREETGLEGRSRGKLGDVKYVYRFEGRSIFKIVTFYLLEWESGEIDALCKDMRVEVEVAFWLPLERAVKELSYPGERKMAEKALELLTPKAPPPA
jgi:8-oxo-dGTP pyrophosphatase MutT (NUDIX family)